MKQGLELKIGQSLSMTPQMQQAIRLLQLSTLELKQEIQIVLESNPFLEIDEEDDSTIETLDEFSDDQPEADYEFDNEIDWKSLASKSSASGEVDGLETRNAQVESLYDSLMWQLQMSHFSIKDNLCGQIIIEAIDESGFLTTDLADLLPVAESHWQELCERLNQDQATLSDDIEEQVQIAEYIQLTGAPELEEMATVLAMIQNFDPPGVGARDLKECLLLQLRHLNSAKRRPTLEASDSSEDKHHPHSIDQDTLQAAIRIVSDFSDIIERKDFKLLLKKTQYSQAVLLKSLRLLQSLETSPGERVFPQKVDYVTPDVIVTKHNGRWHVALNPEINPRLAVNESYAAFAQKHTSNTQAQALKNQTTTHSQTLKDQTDQEFIKNHLTEAKWFMRSLVSRNDTLLKVAQQIIIYQQEFLEQGPVAMKPLILADIAAKVEMHESTISRVTTQKYMHTPRGVFELKYFFSSHVNTANGDEASSTAIRAKISQIVAQESGQKPLSDSKIAALLNQEGIEVARRTVAKYRELNGIPPSNERKKLLE